MNATPSVLLVDDNPLNLDVLALILQDEGLELAVATTGERALELINRQPPDLVLLDVMMPGLTGFEVCRQIKAQPRTADVPVIFVTARTGDVAEGFAAGGVDYVSKPIQPDEVRARVRHQIMLRRMTDELKSLNKALEERVRERTAELTRSNLQLREEINERRFVQDRLSYMASHDFVTRLYNRSAMEAHASELLARNQTQDLQAVFLLIDLNQFRLVNETCGVIAGDELLRQFADLVTGSLGRSDFLARLGGDKFALLVEGAAAADEGRQVAQRIQDQIDDFMFQWNGRVFRLTAALAAVPISRDIVSFDQLMLLADETAYLAKREGLPQLRIYSPQLEAAAAWRKTTNWAFTLQDAVRQDHFLLHYQCLEPLHPSAGQGLRIETLIRLRDPQDQDQPLVLPGEFIGAAERFHLMADIDRWVIRQVLRFIDQNPLLRAGLDQVTINLSALSLREATLVGHVRGLLEGFGIPGSLLCFEITETEAIVNYQTAREVMSGLRALGCRLTLDDFGSGFASFAYLRDLPFDSLKIDGGFVRDMDRNEGNYAMVKSMVELAASLKKPVTAEFVETEAVAHLLRGLQVDYAQGYHFHRPCALTPTLLGQDIQRWQARVH